MMLGGIGNLVLLLPALRALRAHSPQSDIVLLTGEPGVEGILNNERVIDGAILFDRRKGSRLADAVRIIKKVRKMRFDRVFVASSTNALKASLMTRLMGIPVRVGEDIKRMGWFYTVKVPFTAGTHETDGAINLIDAVDIKPLSTVPSLTILEHEAEYVDQYLSERGVAEERCFIGVHAGSGFKGLHKRWPKERFAQLIMQVTDRVPTKVLLMGEKQEAALNEEILALSGNSALNTAGDLEIWHTAALIKKCRLFVSNDSGLAHIAAAVQTPLVVLFGETNIHRIAPRGSSVVLVRKEPTDAHPDNILLRITVEDVWQAVMNAMGVTPPRNRYHSEV